MTLLLLTTLALVGCAPYDPYNPDDPSPCIQPPTFIDAMRPQVRRPPEQETKPVCGRELHKATP